MTRSSLSKEASPATVERQLLRAICTCGGAREEILGTLDRLMDYTWLVPEHATVFQAIRRAVRLGYPSWRDILPAQATLMGFPDIEWSQYLATESDEAPSLSELATRLIG
jgi:hypothetical protein